MNVVIVKKVPERTKRLILSKFPHDWKVVMVTSEELNKELNDAEVIIPEHHIIDGPLLDRAKNLKLDSDSQIPSFENDVHKDPDYPIETYAP